MSMPIEQAEVFINSWVISERPANKDEILANKELISKMVGMVRDDGGDDCLAQLNVMMDDYIKTLNGETSDEDPVFGGGGVPEDMVAKSRSKKDETGKKRNATRSRITDVITGRATDMAKTPYGDCARVISRNAALVAYLTPTPEHFDISKSSVKSKEDYVTRFNLKYVGPGPVKGYVVALPANAFEEVNKVVRNNEDPNTCDVARAQDPNQPYILNFYSPSYFHEVFINQVCAGSIKEAEELWTPYVSKRYVPSEKRYNIATFKNPKDATEGVDDNVIVAGTKNSLVVQVYYSKANGSDIPYSKAKHALRSKLQTPGNYIPARKYETIEIKDTYSTEEVKTLNETYFSRYSTAKFKGKALLNTLDPLSSNVTLSFDPDNNSQKISASKFFTTLANESVMKEPVDHWFNKDSEGNPMKVKAIGQGLVKRVLRENKNKTGSTAYLVYKDMQTQQNPDGTAYVPDFSEKGEFSKIGAACKKYGVKLEPKDLIAFFTEANVLRGKSSSGKKGKSVSTKPFGANVFGLLISNKNRLINDAIREAASSAQAS